MKKNIKTIAQTLTSVILLAAISVPALAQKLPGIQEGSLRAPAGVKIDGKLSEWGDTYQALNKNVNVLYSVANDDDNIYFVIKSTDQMISNKILGGGVRVAINTENKKSEKDAYQVILPVDLKKLGSMMAGMRASMGANGRPDSAALEGMRRKAVAAFKDINLVNFKTIPDSAMSIYNEYGIKAYVDFDTKGALVMEMAVPLKEMKMTNSSSFTYNIKLPGVNVSAMMNAAMSAGAMDNARVAAVEQAAARANTGGGSFGGGGIPRSMADMANLVSPTDFWGKYTNVK